MGNAECSLRIQIGQGMVDGLPPADLKSSSCPAPAADSRLVYKIRCKWKQSVDHFDAGLWLYSKSSVMYEGV